MTPKHDAYALLEQHFSRILALQETEGHLHWDAAVMMPEGGAEERREQIAVLAALTHDLLTAPYLEDWLKQTNTDVDNLEPWQRANVQEMTRIRRHAVAVPADLVEALSRATSSCEQTWRTARLISDFKAVRPKLEEVIRLTRESAQARAETLESTPYNALLDQFEPGLTSDVIDTVFSDLAEFLPPFLEKVLDQQEPFLPRPELSFPQEEQEKLGRHIIQTMGFNFAHGRLDVSAHPFCGGTPDDVRITTRYREENYADALMGVIHETGHGLYERGLPKAWRRQPVGLARGMAMHESQSLLMEMQAGRSRAFFSFLGPLVRSTFGVNGPEWSDDVQYQRAIHVRRGFIRVDADEVTYPLHVILRYRLEKSLIDGSLSVSDLPDAWNTMFKDLLGVEVPDHRHGVMQDVHWYEGLIGYFPTYTLGALTAAQLYAAACASHPDIPDHLAQGDFTQLLQWLGTRVHAHASSLPSRDILVQATGKPLDAGVFKAHLTRRYML